jgi:hypothetical protein
MKCVQMTKHVGEQRGMAILRHMRRMNDSRRRVGRLSFIDPRTHCEQSSIIFERCPMSFELRSISANRVTVAKPSGLGMVSGSQHAAGCGTDHRKRPPAARFITGPHRAAANPLPASFSPSPSRLGFQSQSETILLPIQERSVARVRPVRWAVRSGL